MRKRSKTDPKRAFLYARVSTVEQAERELSLPAQLDAMRKYCQANGIAVVEEFVERGVSGREDRRPEFQRMLAKALTPSSDVGQVLVYQTSRFMRDAMKAQVHKRRLAKAGVRVVATTQEFSDNHTGRFVEGILELVDQLESDNTSMRTSDAMRECARQGYFPGSRAPLGFKIDKIKLGPKLKRSRLVPNAEEAGLVREVFQLYVSEQGALAAARELNRRGRRRRNGGVWDKGHVLKVVGESAAIGRYLWGKRASLRGAHEQKEPVEIKVEPIIDRELWDLAQRLREQRDPKSNPGRTGSSPMLLAGLVACGKCESSYQLETSGKKTPNGRLTYRYYNCRTHLRVGKEACDGFRVPEETLDQAVLEHLADRLFTTERCRQIVKELVEEQGLLRQKTNAQRESMKAELDDVERRIRKYEAAFEDSDADLSALAPRIAELRARQAEIEATLAKVVPLRPPPEHLYSDKSIAAFQKQVRELFLSGDNALTRNYLRFLVEQITLTDGLVELTARSEAAIRMMEVADGTTGQAPGTPTESKSPAGFTSEALSPTCVVTQLRLLDLNQRQIG